MRNGWRVLLIAVLSSCALAGLARAEDLRAAKEHFERYGEAAREYEMAFEAKQDPALLFNIGQAYRHAGELAKAIVAFRSYLRRVPDAENRAEVQQRIGEMQRIVDEQKRTQEKPPGGTLAPGETRTTEPSPPPPPAPAPAPAVSRAPNRSRAVRTKITTTSASAVNGQTPSHRSPSTTWMSMR
jgi:tetratricopeptide (TPR) repeat protein